MASITSIISFFILLLATFSYSAPIGQEYGTSTPDYEYTTNQTIIERVDPVYMRLISDDESTGVPVFNKERSSDESDSDEVTTEGVTFSPRTIEDYSYPSSTDAYEKYNYEVSSFPSVTEINDKRNYEESSFPSATETNEERSVDDFSYNTLESATNFNQRAIRPVESEEDVESSTVYYPENQMESSTNVEPSSSVDSFGKYTGLLNDEQSSTSEYEPTEESTIRLPVKTQRLTKTVSIIPGKITETKIYANLPSKTSVVIQPVEQEQLSQVQNQSVVEKTKSDYWNGSWFG